MSYQLNTIGAVVRVADGAVISDDPTTIDRQEYEDWLAHGNTPEPAQGPSPADVIKAQIAALEAAHPITPRALREFMRGAADALGAQTPGIAKLKQLDDAIAALRSQL